MKKLVLLITGVLMTLTTVTAAEKITAVLNSSQEFSGEDFITNRYRDAQPIQFVERGVEFLVFPNGSFDFNTNLDQTSGDIYYRKNSRRTSFNTTYGAPGRRITYSSPRRRGVLVTHDSYGRVRRIGNVFLNYNYRSQIKRIGAVYISYNRRGLVKQIGGLRIRYNHRGQIIAIQGHVNYSNQGCGFCGVTGCTANHMDYDTPYGNDNGHHTYDDDDDDDDDDDLYYYRKGESIEHKHLNDDDDDDD